MADYIKREDALDAIRVRIRQVGMETPLVLSIGQAVVDVPAADVKPVVHARWAFDRGDVGNCSNCGAEVLDREVRWHKYCYFCGAMMDGEG